MKADGSAKLCYVTSPLPNSEDADGKPTSHQTSCQDVGGDDL